MNYVVDASTIIAVIANELEKEQLVNITKGADLLAPASIHGEIGNAFSALITLERKLAQVAQKMNITVV
jgi:predicted nucleic acid-binding protein